MVAVAHDLQADSALVHAAQDGDRDAFAQLFRRHYEGVRRACLRRLHDSREADELAQAAFVRAWERIDRCSGDRRFGGWVQVIARNLCIDSLRQQRRVAPSAFPNNDSPAPLTQQPENFVLRREASNLVHLALADLPPRQRDVVVARDLQERRTGEIAAALGLSVGAVDSLLLRGRRRLAANLEKLGGEAGAVSAASTSSVAGGAVAASGRLTVLAQTFSDAISRATYQVAASIGMVPGIAGPAQRLAAAAVVSGALATGMALPAALPAVIAPRPPAPAAVPAARVPYPPAALAAPAAPPAQTPSAPAVTAPAVLAPAVPLASVSAPAPAAPAVLAPVATAVGALGRTLDHAVQALTRR